MVTKSQLRHLGYPKASYQFSKHYFDAYKHKKKMHITNHGRSIEQCDTSLSQWQGQKKDRGLSRADMYVFQKKNAHLGTHVNRELKLPVLTSRLCWSKALLFITVVSSSSFLRRVT
jgi:hypothetical protein